MKFLVLCCKSWSGKSNNRTNNFINICKKKYQTHSNVQVNNLINLKMIYFKSISLAFNKTSKLAVIIINISVFSATCETTENVWDYWKTIRGIEWQKWLFKYNLTSICTEKKFLILRFRHIFCAIVFLNIAKTGKLFYIKLFYVFMLLILYH